MPIRRSDLNIPAVYSGWEAELPGDRPVNVKVGPPPKTDDSPPPPPPACPQQFVISPTDTFEFSLAATTARMAAAGAPYLLTTITVLRPITVRGFTYQLTRGTGKILLALIRNDPLTFDVNPLNLPLDHERVISKVLLDASEVNLVGTTLFAFSEPVELQATHYHLLLIDAKAKDLHPTPLSGVQVAVRQVPMPQPM